MRTLGIEITLEVIGGLILAVIVPFGIWLFRTLLRPEIRISTALEQGPTTHELGFTETAVKVTLANVSSKDIQIKDIRLMFSKHFGTPVFLFEAPSGRSHPKLPTCLASGTEESWYIPAEQLSNLVRRLCRPPRKAGTVPTSVRLKVRGLTGTNKIYKGPSFSLSTDPSSHWPWPQFPCREIPFRSRSLTVATSLGRNS